MGNAIIVFKIVFNIVEPNAMGMDQTLVYHIRGTWMDEHHEHPFQTKPLWSEQNARVNRPTISHGISYNSTTIGAPSPNEPGFFSMPWSYSSKWPKWPTPYPKPWRCRASKLMKDISMAESFDRSKSGKEATLICFSDSAVRPISSSSDILKVLHVTIGYHCSNSVLTCNLLFIDGIPEIEDVRSKIIWFSQGLGGAILQAYRDMVCIVSARKIRAQVNKSRDVTNKKLGIPALFDPCHFLVLDLLSQLNLKSSQREIHYWRNLIGRIWGFQISGFPVGHGAGAPALDCESWKGICSF